jgi:hypothetical protein
MSRHTKEVEEIQLKIQESEEKAKNHLEVQVGLIDAASSDLIISSQI